jgi:hypothetical protein
MREIDSILNDVSDSPTGAVQWFDAGVNRIGMPF